MDFSQLRYFQKIAELQHLTRAANELHVSQPALSKVLKTLETELGSTLFDRKGKGMELNEAGRIMKQYTDVILDAMNQAQKELEEYRQTDHATITISTRIAFELLVEAIAEFRRIHPSAKFDIVTDVLLEDSVDTHSDITFFSGMTPAENENTGTLLGESIRLAVAQDHPLARQEQVSLTELSQADYIACAPLDSTLNKMNGLYCEMAGFCPRIAMITPTSHALLMMVQENVGIAMVPEISWIGKMEGQYRIKLLKIINPECRRYIKIRWKTKGSVSKGAVLFREFLIAYFREKFSGAL